MTLHGGMLPLAFLATSVPLAGNHERCMLVMQRAKRRGLGKENVRLFSHPWRDFAHLLKSYFSELDRRPEHQSPVMRLPHLFIDAALEFIQAGFFRKSRALGFLRHGQRYPPRNSAHVF